MTDEMRAGVGFGSGMIMARPGALYARPAGLCARIVGATIVVLGAGSPPDSPKAKRAVGTADKIGV